MSDPIHCHPYLFLHNLLYVSLTQNKIDLAEDQIPTIILDTILKFYSVQK